MLLCFTAISLLILGNIIHEFAEYQGFGFFILLHGLIFLLILFIAYTVYIECREAAMCAQIESHVPFDAMKSLFMYMPSAVMTLEKDFTIIDVNELLIKVTGFHPCAIKGKKCYDILGNGEICCDCIVQKVLITGNPEYGTQIKYDTDGKQIYGKQTAIPIKDQYGNVKYIYEIVTDITQEVRLERENADILLEIVTSMAHLIESRDPLTGTHCINVQNIALSIGEKLGLNEKEFKDLSIAAIIHDIGKLSIPAEILSKPTKLTELQFSLIKQHSRSGYEMLKNVESPWPLAEIVYQHHERLDGSGYPRNLKGDEILIEARIMAVADVVEAMASHRPYRASLGIEAALEEIEKNKGILYDNTVADACLRLFREKGYQLT